MEMRYWLVFGSVSLSTVLMVFLLSNLFAEISQENDNGKGRKMFRFMWQKKATPKIKHRVAILTSQRDDLFEEIMKGFSETLRKNDPGAEYYIRVYDAQGDSMKKYEYADEILRGSFDLLYTEGTSATLTAHKISKMEKLTMPIIFSGIPDPVKNNVVASLDSSGNNFTGVRAEINYPLVVDLFCTLRPNIKRVVLPYDPTSFAGYMGRVLARDVESAFLKKGISVKHIQIFNPNEIVSKVEESMKSIDAIMIFNDTVGNVGVACLVKLCNKYHVNLCAAANLELAKQGVAFAFGLRHYYTGVEVAKKALKILVDGVNPTDIPVGSSIKGCRAVVNTRASKRQGFDVDENLLYLMSNGRVIDGSFDRV